MTTFGIEEEYFLVDPTTLRPVYLAGTVLRELSRDPSEGGCVTGEFLASQVERATAILTDIESAEADLSRFRAKLASAARLHGAMAVGTGTPFDASTSPTVTDTSRYRVVERSIRGIVRDHQVGGTHIHVGVPNRDAGVIALNRVRIWLPVLMALTGNSPFWRGSDTGFDSWRTVLMRRWTTAGIPPCFADAADYDRRIRRLVGLGATSDLATIAWYARLSEVHPTLEVRVADAQLDLAPTLLLAALTRGLVATALADAERGIPPLIVEQELLDAALWHASRDGIRGTLLDPDSKELKPAKTVTDTMVRYIEEALGNAGDLQRVAALLERLWHTGTGAQKQQETYCSRGLPGLSVLLESGFSS